jgi:hypothetical protein
LGVVDDLVVDVSDVHDVADGNAEEQEGAAEDVNLEEGAEVSDVAVVIDGGAAGVHAKRRAWGETGLGDEGIDLSREGVEKTERHGGK